MHSWLDPQVGRWISEDPIGFAAGDANVYRYVGNSPTTSSDPTGTTVSGYEFNFGFTCFMGRQLTLFRLWDDKGREAWVIGGSARLGLHADLSGSAVLSDGSLPDFINGMGYDVSAGAKIGVGGSVGYNTKSGGNIRGRYGIGMGASAGYGGSQVLWKNW